VITAFRREARPATQSLEVTLTAATPVWLEAAGGQLRQIVWNLLRNAAEAMPRGGRIGVELGTEVDPDGQARALLRVSDTGDGIAAADREHIFEPFFSTKRGGTGLGLATVARIVGDHQGDIEVASEPGRGTTFSLRLPARSAPGVSQPDAA